MSVLLKVVLVGGALYAFAVLGMALAQTALVFPRAAVGVAPELPAQTTRLRLDLAASDTLHGVRIVGRNPNAPLLLGFGGNAWNAEAMALYLPQIAPDHDVVAFHYRGYAPSTGTPSAQALLADALVIHDTTTAPNGVVAIGFSIGSGVAAYLAAKRPLKSVILVTPFDSLRAVAQQALPFLPVRWLFRHQIDTLAALSAQNAPVTLITATQDEVIPPVRTDALIAGLAAAGRTKASVVPIAAGHNDIYNLPEAQAALRRAIAAAK